MFYFTLENLSPRCRSCLSAIQLVALVMSNFIIIYGMDAILRPFVDGIKNCYKGVN